MRPDLEAASQELADEIAPKATDMADLAAEYYQVCLAISEWEKRKAGLNRTLKAYIEHTGEPLKVEGLPPLKVVSGSGARKYDVRSMPEPLVRRLHELGVLACDLKMVDALTARGELPSETDRFLIPGGEVVRLVWGDR